MISFYVTKSGEPFAVGASKNDTFLTVGTQGDNDINLPGVYAAKRFLMVKIQAGVLKASCIGSVRGLKVNKSTLSLDQEKMYSGSGTVPITLDKFEIFLKIGDPDPSWPTEVEKQVDDEKPVDAEDKPFSSHTTPETSLFNASGKTPSSDEIEKRNEKLEELRKQRSTREEKVKETPTDAGQFDDDFELFDTPDEPEDEVNIDDLMDSFEQSKNARKSGEVESTVTPDESGAATEDDYNGLFDSDDDDDIEFKTEKSTKRKKSLRLDESGLLDALGTSEDPEPEVETEVEVEIVEEVEEQVVEVVEIAEPAKPKALSAVQSVPITKAPASAPEKPKKPKDEKPQNIERKTTVRYFEQMTINKNFPLLVVFSKEEIDKIVQKDVAQIEGAEKIKVKREKPIVTVIPQFPGCICVPERQDIDLTPENSEVTFWVTPVAEGKLPAASVKILYEGKIIQKIDCPTKVVKSTAAKVTAGAAIISPIFFSAIESVGLDPKSQVQSGFPVVKQLSNWLESQSASMFGEPILSGMTLLGLIIGFISMIIALVFYFRARPKESDPVADFMQFSLNKTEFD